MPIKIRYLIIYRIEPGASPPAAPGQTPAPGPAPDIILISSTGPAADYRSDMFGYYLCAGDYEGSRYYRQLHSVDRGNPHFAYKTSRGWAISTTLGDTRDGYVRLRSEDMTDTIDTAHNWKYMWGGSYSSDPDVIVTGMRSLPPPCPEISISARVHHHCAGVYQPTDQYCHGRVVYNNVTNNKVMLVDDGYGSCWLVLDNINSDWETAVMRSGSAPDTCPAHPRTNKGSGGRTCWWYRDKNGEYQDDGDNWGIALENFTRMLLISVFSLLFAHIFPYLSSLSNKKCC